MKYFNLKENATEILAIMSSIASFIFLGLLFFVTVPKGNEHLIDIMGGAIVLNTVASVYGYYFGQSKKRDIVPEAGQSTTLTQTSSTEEINK